jgi:hypothetical protein
MEPGRSGGLGTERLRRRRLEPIDADEKEGRPHARGTEPVQKPLEDRDCAPRLLAAAVAV